MTYSMTCTAVSFCVFWDALTFFTHQSIDKRLHAISLITNPRQDNPMAGDWRRITYQNIPCTERSVPRRSTTKSDYCTVQLELRKTQEKQAFPLTLTSDAPRLFRLGKSFWQEYRLSKQQCSHPISWVLCAHLDLSLSSNVPNTVTS